MKDTPAPPQPFRAGGHYGSTLSLKSLANDGIGNGTKGLKRLDCNGGSLISLQDHPELTQLRRRSPSLPPIYNKEQEHIVSQDQQRDLGIEGLCYRSQKLAKQHHHRRRSCDRGEDPENHYGLHGEERGGETSGYASDSVDVPVVAPASILPSCKQPCLEMSEKTWQNPYFTTPESSLPPSRRLSDGRIGELNRPRWGGIWGQETARGDPPPPSWLARLGHTSQVLVINHDSASSPDSSTTGSTGSETAKTTHLRGHNLPVDADILQEREARRQKALELQQAIKQQLEEKDRQRREERERRMREERLEEERIKREQEKERERFEEEQRKLKEKEMAKLKQAEAMREVLQAAEKLAKEEKRNRWKREGSETDRFSNVSKVVEPKTLINNLQKEHYGHSTTYNQQTVSHSTSVMKEEKDSTNQEKEDSSKEYSDVAEQTLPDVKSIQVPISKDVAIVLSGRLEDTEAFNKSNLQLLNLVVSPSPRVFDSSSNNLSMGVNAVMTSMASPLLSYSSSRISPGIVENRLLTPSKYRSSCGRDFGTQTDIESDLQELSDKMQDSTLKEHSIKERKDTTNASRRDVEKTTTGGSLEDSPMKQLQRSKSQPRTSIESRPRWNANRPGTRYRTQSEKDPHYQRRMRLRRRQVESSDERSRSPSPDRRKSSNAKSKIRNVNRRKPKIDHYDADLSMDSLNSIIPLRIDKNGRINIEDTKCLQNNEKVELENNSSNDGNAHENEDSNVWCGQKILSKLSSLKNGLLVKQMQWDSERCLVSPAASEFY